jgi:membrane associated rhomboid family serine protease
MGIYDRDYVRHSSRGGFATLGAWSVTTWLIGINLALFVIDMSLAGRPHLPQLDELDDVPRDVRTAPRDEWMRSMPPLQRAGYFSIDKALKHGQVWRVVTFQFVHGSAGQLIVAMLGLFLFGPIVEGHFGPRRYLAYYLLCGAAGALVYVLLWATHLVITDPATPLLGASACAMGVLVGAATFAPDMEVTVVVLPVKIRVLAWIMLGVAAYSVRAGGANGGAVAHLGGGLMGLLFVRRQELLNFAAPTRGATYANRPASRRRTSRAQKDWSKDMNR